MIEFVELSYFGTVSAYYLMKQVVFDFGEAFLVSGLTSPYKMSRLVWYNEAAFLFQDRVQA